MVVQVSWSSEILHCTLKNYVSNSERHNKFVFLLNNKFLNSANFIYSGCILCDYTFM